MSRTYRGEELARPIGQRSMLVYNVEVICSNVGRGEYVYSIPSMGIDLDSLEDAKELIKQQEEIT
jgi:hypothetical protein